MNVMHEELERLGSEHVHIDPYMEYGLTKQPAERTDPIAFLNEKTK